MTQFQVNKTDLTQSRLVETLHDADSIAVGEILVKIERFGFTANNVTYAVAGDTLGYWQFFPPIGDDGGDGNFWGVIPVWGFAEVVKSACDEMPVGERLFGYFPPASHLVMKPDAVSDQVFFDSVPHRADLPRGYNIYRRVAAEPDYNRAHDDLRMLLFPLYLTSFCLWDIMRFNGWYGAEQVLVISASSKTSIGLGYALANDEEAPISVGLTSSKNRAFVEGLDIYDHTLGYDGIDGLENKPTVVVDMSGNAELLGAIHEYLGDNMVKTLNVGLTHWESNRRDPRINRSRSEFFFAPSHIQMRMKEWGAQEFNAKSSGFIVATLMKSTQWLEQVPMQGFSELKDVYDQVREGKMDPKFGITFEL